MPAAGLPVASITTSTAVAAHASSPLVDEARPADARLVPADGAAGAARPLRVEIGDHRHLKARDGRHLGEEHRAELAGADQRGADRPAGFAAGREERCQVHGKDRPARIHGVLQKKINSRAAASDDMAVTGSQACGAAKRGVGNLERSLSVSVKVASRDSRPRSSKPRLPGAD